MYTYAYARVYTYTSYLLPHLYLSDHELTFQSIPVSTFGVPLAFLLFMFLIPFSVCLLTCAASLYAW